MLITQSQSGAWWLRRTQGTGGWPYVDTVRGSGGGDFLDKAKGLYGGRRVGGSGGGAPRSPDKFSKIFIQKPMKNYNFRTIFQNFNEKFVKKCLEFLAKIWENLEVCIYRGRSPAKLAILLKKVQNSNGNLVFFEIFHKLSKKIWVSEANLNKN